MKPSDYLEQGTALAGYEEHGPYHCEKCVHMQGGAESDSNICLHPIVALDPKLKHPKEGQTTVDPEYGCCRFVKQSLEKDEDDLPKVIRRATK